MDTGRTHIIEARNPGAEKLCHLGCFLRHRNIRCSTGTDYNLPHHLFFTCLDLQDTGDFIPDCPGQHRLHSLILFSYGSCTQYVDAFSAQCLIDFYQMICRLALAKHHFFKPLPDFAVVIQLSKTQILVRKVFQFGLRLLYRNFVVFYLS